MEGELSEKKSQLEDSKREPHGNVVVPHLEQRNKRQLEIAARSYASRPTISPVKE